MKAVCCDRCGTFFSLSDSRLKEGYKLKQISESASRYEKSLDICPECQKELTDWMKKGKSKGGERKE